ncbi:30S ribosomal protein S20 [Candidatus Nomurabacteria bacterium]|nr:30S ribosomal protein S20 [Candidatus Nomurabacteria bacterium]
MPNKKAAIKYLRQSVKRQTANNLMKRKIKELVKQGKKAVVDGTIETKAKELAHDLQKAVDKAVNSGVLKANTANRRKSRFMAMIQKTEKAPAAEKTEKKTE